MSQMAHTITSTHLSTKHYNSVSAIMMTEREHGEKIQLISKDYLDLCMWLRIEKFGATGWPPALPKCTEPLFITFCSIYVYWTSHSGLTHLRLKCTWLLRQKKRVMFFMQCIGIIFIFLREALILPLIIYNHSCRIPFWLCLWIPRTTMHMASMQLPSASLCFVVPSAWLRLVCLSTKFLIPQDVVFPWKKNNCYQSISCSPN